MENRRSVRRNEQTQKLVTLAILTAIVFVLQFISLFMRFATFSITLVLVPIVLGCAICNKWAGAWLGFVFAVAVFLTGDATLFLEINVFGTIVTVFAKGILAGLVAGLVYGLLEKFNRYFAILCSAIVAPVVNTGVFIIGCYAFFYDYIASLANGEAMFPFVLVTFVGINFFIELGVNIVLAPTALRIVNVIKKEK